MFDSGIARILLAYIPISIIGLWRWSFWIVRRVAASMYRPNVGVWPKNKPRPTVSVVTPVYNEDPELFEEAVQSWVANGVDEIIAVIDKTNTRHIVQYEHDYVRNKSLKTKFRLIVQPTKGKRAGLCDGIGRATGDLIVLVDSDTVWDPDVLEKTLPYFLNKQVGGATLTQRVKSPDNTATVIFDIMLWSRYQEEVPALLGVGKAFNTLSGRTAFYRREAIFSEEHDNLHLLRHEHFMGTRSISGDDKRLTHLILEQGWYVSYVVGPKVYTSGMRSMRQFLKQRLRWTRNSWRGDLRAVFVRRWMWRHPALAIFRLDSFVQPFVMLLGPVVFTLALYKQDWLFAAILLAWWTVSRTIKLFGYFRAHPARIIYLPAYILMSYVNAVIKIYALATLIEHSWATRWHQTRMQTKRMFRKVLTIGSGVTVLLLFVSGVVLFALYSRDKSAADVAVPQAVETVAFTNDIDFASSAPLVPTMPVGAVTSAGIKQYIVMPGDTLIELSNRFDMTVQELKKINGLRDPDVLNIGQSITYYQKEVN